MSDPITAAATCFALLLLPNSGAPAIIISGYPTVEMAKQARNDIQGERDAAGRIDHERYLASPQYAVDQARAAAAAAEAARTGGCHADAGTPCVPLRNWFSTSMVGHVQVWSMLQVITAPPRDCQEQSR
jgi:hypothetical protein